MSNVIGAEILIALNTVNVLNLSNIFCEVSGFGPFYRCEHGISEQLNDTQRITNNWWFQSRMGSHNCLTLVNNATAGLPVLLPSVPVGCENEPGIQLPPSFGPSISSP